MAEIKKIAFICQTLDIGGAETFNSDLLTQLRKNNIQIQSFVTHPPFAKILRGKGLQTQNLKIIMDIVGNWKGLVKALFYLPSGILQYYQVVRQVKASGAQLILFSGFTEKILVTPIAKMFGIPVVWIEFGPISPLFKKFGGLPKLLYRLVKDIPLAVIVPSNHTKSDVISSGRISLAKLWLTPCGRAITHEDIQPYLSIPTKKNQIICVSRLEAGKGQDLLIQALPKIVKKYPDTQLIITGKEGTLPDLQRLVSRMHLEKQVKFVGWVPNVLQSIAESQVCVFPSVWALEGFGLVTLEAMALGKPVVAFRTGPAPEIISHNENGLLAKPGDIKDLEQQILSLFDDPKHAKELSKKAAADFFAKYQIDPVAEQYIEVFKDAVAHAQAKEVL